MTWAFFSMNFERAGVHPDFVSERFENTAMGRFILEDHTFVAEVEREKIVERATRGKLLHVRKGQPGQGTGRGVCGYGSRRVVVVATGGGVLIPGRPS